MNVDNFLHDRQSSESGKGDRTCFGISGRYSNSDVARITEQELGPENMRKTFRFNKSKKYAN